MNRFIISAVCTFLFFINLCFSQSTVERYVESIGGRERIDSINTAVFKVKMVSSHIESATSIISVKKDYKFRIRLSYEDGRSSISCYDGVKNTGTDKAMIAMVEAVNKKVKKFFVFNEVIFVPKSDFKDEPDRVINGIDCNVLSHNDVEWKQFYKYYFDKETHLLVAEDSFGYTTFYENYQPTGGILFPMRSKRNVGEVESITEYTEIILNPELPDDIFDCNPK